MSDVFRHLSLRNRNDFVTVASVFCRRLGPIYWNAPVPERCELTDASIHKDVREGSRSGRIPRRVRRCATESSLHQGVVGSSGPIGKGSAVDRLKRFAKNLNHSFLAERRVRHERCVRPASS